MIIKFCTFNSNKNILKKSPGPDKLNSATHINFPLGVQGNFENDPLVWQLITDRLAKGSIGPVL